ncbi:MAG: ATPase, T2SS/T4P/T4SS family, partial [Microbacteriaceae bacterium]
GHSRVRIGGRWHSVGCLFDAEQGLRDWCVEVFESVGIALNYKNPLASIGLGNFRIHAALAFGITEHTQVTIRRLDGTSGDFLFATGSASSQKFLGLSRALIAGKSILIAGAAGSGKTTLLRALLQQLTDFRVVTLEDTAELRLAGENVVSLVSREPNQEGAGSVDLSRLLIEALRMSPDRIAVGEVRSAELVPMLEALNTGHQGAGATIHANSLNDLAARLEALGLRAGLAPTTLARQVVSAFSFAVFMRRSPEFEIAEVAAPRLIDQRLEFRHVA